MAAPARSRPRTSAGCRAARRPGTCAMPSRARASICAAGDRRAHVEPFGGADRALAVQVEIGRHALERAGAVEDGVGEPRRVGRRGHQRHGAGAPLAVEVADRRDVGVGHDRTSLEEVNYSAAVLTRPIRERLDQRLRREQPEMSWARLRAAIEKGQVTVNGAEQRDPGAEVVAARRRRPRRQPQGGAGGALALRSALRGRARPGARQAGRAADRARRPRGVPGRGHRAGPGPRVHGAAPRPPRLRRPAPSPRSRHLRRARRGPVPRGARGRPRAVQRPRLRSPVRGAGARRAAPTTSAPSMPPSPTPTWPAGGASRWPASRRGRR